MSVDALPRPRMDEPAGTGPSPGSAPAQRRAHLLELAVVVLILAPSALSFMPSTGAESSRFEVTAIATMLHDIGLVALVALLVWRNREPLTDLGWRLRRPVREMAIGLLAFPMVFAFASWLDAAAARGRRRRAGHAAHLRRPARRAGRPAAGARDHRRRTGLRARRPSHPGRPRVTTDRNAPQQRRRRARCRAHHDANGGQPCLT